MLPEAVASLSDQGRHVQFENERRRVELDRLPRPSAAGTRSGDQVSTQ